MPSAAPPRRPVEAGARPSLPSAYVTTWWVAAASAAVGLAAVAVLESPWRPLLFVTVAPALLAGVLAWSNEDQSAVRWPWVLVQAVGTALVAADLAGAGHQLAYAAAIVGVLAASAPWTVLWVAGASAPGQHHDEDRVG